MEKKATQVIKICEEIVVVQMTIIMDLLDHKVHKVLLVHQDRDREHKAP
jgi:hypothetical protein